MSFYIPAIPQAGDDPKVSQGQILGNFTRLNIDFNVDHVQYSASTNRGQHRKVTFQDVLGADPNKAGNIASLYTKLVSGNPELFYQNSTSVLQLTNPPRTTTDDRHSMTSPWGIKFQFGENPTSPIVFPDPFPGGFTLLTALITPQSSGVVTAITSVTNTQLVYSGSTAVYYLVMGTS